MPTVPPPNYGVEVYTADGVVSSLIPAQYPLIEVATYPPVGGGIDRVEAVPFTKQGVLTVTTSSGQYPIAGGTFNIDSIVARVVTPPTGAAIILNVLKDGVSIFPTNASRPTIAPGSNVAVVGAWTPTMLADGDFLGVTIAQVGSTFAGDTLVASVRLVRIG
jgi:hypothetical protein